MHFRAACRANARSSSKPRTTAAPLRRRSVFRNPQNGFPTCDAIGNPPASRAEYREQSARGSVGRHRPHENQPPASKRFPRVRAIIKAVGRSTAPDAWAIGRGEAAWGLLPQPFRAGNSRPFGMRPFRILLRFAALLEASARCSQGRVRRHGAPGSLSSTDQALRHRRGNVHGGKQGRDAICRP